VVTANKVLVGDPTIQAIITGELGALRHRLLDAISVKAPPATKPPPS
jgi:hypothetical protein